MWKLTIWHLTLVPLYLCYILQTFVAFLNLLVHKSLKKTLWILWLYVCLLFPFLHFEKFQKKIRFEFLNSRCADMNRKYVKFATGNDIVMHSVDEYISCINNCLGPSKKCSLFHFWGFLIPKYAMIKYMHKHPFIYIPVFLLHSVTETVTWKVV